MFWRQIRERFNPTIDGNRGRDVLEYKDYRILTQTDLVKLTDWIYRLIENDNADKKVVDTKIKNLNEKLDLILKELGKEYVPESEKKEPAKLVDKGPDWSQLITSCGSGDWTIASAGPTPTKPKKKRKYTKKKK